MSEFQHICKYNLWNRTICMKYHFYGYMIFAFMVPYVCACVLQCYLR